MTRREEAEEVDAELLSRLSKPDAKAGRTQRVVLDLLLEPETRLVGLLRRDSTATR